MNGPTKLRVESLNSQGYVHIGDLLTWMEWTAQRREMIGAYSLAQERRFIVEHLLMLELERAGMV